MKTLQEAYEKTQQNTKFGDKGTIDILKIDTMMF